ncbi:hypothetical protein C1645_823864 [Glomus cerebriforme]|uniref:Uncharacterized protein n=1 Tax=Glomus cerebriforme TaxID=658196 RepID=A0A397T4K7_9GLOM|nr:hypothetical protein C1645_823864 [Glomus cerebriforme]
MNSKNLEQLLNINKFLSTTPFSNIHSVQAYVLTINISDNFSIIFDTPYKTLSPLADINIALTQNDGARSGTLRINRWQNRKHEILERCQNTSDKIIDYYKFINYK